MWCPGKHAKVYSWVDKSGATHREIILKAQKGLTSTMAQWFFAWYVLGLGDPIVEFQGKVSAPQGLGCEQELSRLS
jgi:hypothetical protein